jgi:hypothetical protein
MKLQDSNRNNIIRAASHLRSSSIDRPIGLGMHDTMKLDHRLA